MRVRLYVEGGPVGVDSDALRAFRSAFKNHLVRLDPRLKNMEVIARGSVHTTVKSYAEGFRQYAGERNLALLVDSDGPVTAASCAEHLRSKLDSAHVPAEARVNLFLMVQCMESWFVADFVALQACFGNKLRQNALPRNLNVEAISVKDVLAALHESLRQSPTAKYRKVQHGTRILAELNPAQVAGKSRHARELHEFLRKAAGS